MLHVRVVAAAYGVPRVTLPRIKAVSYAAHWDPLMPYDVRVPDLDPAVARALAAGADPQVRAAAEELAQRAHANAQQVAERALRRAAERTDRERERRAAERTAAWEPIAARRRACDAATLPLRTEVEELRRALDQAGRDAGRTAGRPSASRVRRWLPEAVRMRRGT